MFEYIKFSVFIVVMLFVLGIWIIPIIQVSRKELDVKEKISLKNELRKTLAQIFGGIFLLGSFYGTLNTLEVSKQGQITDRLSRAIDHISNNQSMETRLGGIYALERVARESHEDHEQIINILCAYLRPKVRNPNYHPMSWSINNQYFDEWYGRQVYINLEKKGEKKGVTS